MALRQLGELWINDAVVAHRGKLGAFLQTLLERLAALLGCEVRDLRLDHDPALGARAKVFDKRGKHIDYDPPANDVAHLIYRPHGAEFVGSHHIKTNVRGEHGQHPDRVLIKKQRRLERAEALKKLAGKPVDALKAAVSKPRKMQGPKLRNANRWPPKGSRKINWNR